MRKKTTKVKTQFLYVSPLYHIYTFLKSRCEKNALCPFHSVIGQGYRRLSISATASRSHRSFSKCPLWPFTQTTFTEWASSRSRSAAQRSAFNAGLPSAFFQFRARQPFAQPLDIPSATYLLSVVNVTRQGSFNDRSASITPVNSIRLLVVARSPPLNSFSFSPYRSTAPHPPGPGLPEQAPSVNISTFFNYETSLSSSLFLKAVGEPPSFQSQ